MPQGRGRDPGGRVKRAEEIDTAVLDGIADRLVHAQGRSGDGAISAPRGFTDAYFDAPTAELVCAGGHSHSRHGIGHQRDSAARASKCHSHCGGIDVVQVNDQPAGEPVIGESTADGTRIAVPQWALRVVQVSDQ